MPGKSGGKCSWCSTAELCRAGDEDPGDDWVVRNCYTNLVHSKERCPVIKVLSEEDFEDMDPDDHKYYKSTVLRSKEYWTQYFKDFSKLNSTLITDLLNTSDNSVSTDPHTLSFIFPFYGHPAREIKIMPRGFVSLPSSFSKKNLHEE